MEWQANRLSSAILMPKSMVLKAAHEAENASPVANAAPGAAEQDIAAPAPWTRPGDVGGAPGAADGAAGPRPAGAADRFASIFAISLRSAAISVRPAAIRPLKRTPHDGIFGARGRCSACPTRQEITT